MSDTDAIEPWNHGVPHCRLCGRNHWARDGCFPDVIKQKMEKRVQFPKSFIEKTKVHLGLESTEGQPVKPAATKRPAKPARGKRATKRRKQK
jgi:hypothetical protein